MDPTFPVHCPHVTIFRNIEIGQDWPTYWHLHTILSAYLGPRRVGARFTASGSHNFLLHENCELMALIKHLQSISRTLHLGGGNDIDIDNITHMSWRWIVIDTYTDESRSMATAGTS